MASVKRVTVVKEDTRERLTGAQVKLRLECNERKMLALIEQGKLTRNVDDDGHSFFYADEIEELIESGGAPINKRDAFIDAQTRSLDKANGFIANLLDLVVKPIQASLEALSKENESLRAEKQRIEEHSLEVHQAYFEMQKTLMLAEVDAEREKANAQLKKDALEILRAQMPAIMQSLVSKRLVDSLETMQLQAILEADMLNKEQTGLVRSVLERRAHEAKKKAGHNEKGNGKDRVAGSSDPPRGSGSSA